MIESREPGPRAVQESFERRTRKPVMIPLMAAQPGSDPMVFRSAQQQWLVGIITAPLVIFLTVNLVQGLSTPQTHPSASARVVGTALFVVMIAVSGGVGIRVMRAGVIVHNGGIVVRNTFRSLWLTWDQIDHFDVEPIWVGTIGVVHLTSGEKLQIWGMQAPNRLLFANSTEASGPVAQLNALLVQRRPSRQRPQAAGTETQAKPKRP